jgi:opacity protein-like surface antigen
MSIVNKSLSHAATAVLLGGVCLASGLLSSAVHAQSSTGEQATSEDAESGVYVNKSQCAKQSAQAACAFEYFYLSAALGANIGGSDLDVVSAANDIGFDVFDVEEDDASIAFKFVLGASLTDRLALEFGYTRLADAEVAFSAITDDPELFFDLARSVRPGAVDGFTLALSYSFYTDENWYMYGRAGVFNWSGSYSSFNVTANQQLPSLEDSDGTDLLLGLGATYRFNERVDVNLEWERYSFDDFDQNVAWLGLTYHFIQN